MNKKVKLSLILTAIILFLLCLPQLILFFPGFLFGERVVYKNFMISSDNAITTQQKMMIDSIHQRLAQFDFYNQKELVYIYLCHSEGLSDFIGFISMSPAGVGFFHWSGNIFIFPDRIEMFRKVNEKVTGELALLIKNSYQDFLIEDIIMHEVLHKLHSDSIGIWAFKTNMPPPHWKAEGFAEYFTYAWSFKDKSTLKNQIRLLIKYYDTFPALFYKKSQLMYAFLTEIEKLDFKEIMSDNISEEETWFKMISWLEDQQHN